MTWIVIVTTAIPAALSHGVVNYPYGERNYTACLFLTDAGYNIVAFQVNFMFNFANFSSLRAKNLLPIR